MIIKEIQIDNFGHFCNYKISNLHAGINEITGLNEFGKTTIAEFIVRIFYGFPDRRRGLNPYPAACDDVNYGGRLICELADGREVTIERLGLGRNGRFSITDNQKNEAVSVGEILSFEENFFREIYALTLAQLAKGGVLTDPNNVVIRRLYGMNYASENLDINDLIKRLTEQSKKLFLPSGSTQELKALYDELEEKKQQLSLLEEKLQQSRKLDLEIAESEKKLKESGEVYRALVEYLDLEKKVNAETDKIEKLKKDFAAVEYNEVFVNNEKTITNLVQNLTLYQEYNNNLLVSKIELETLEKELKNADNEFVKIAEDEVFKHKLMDFSLKEETAIKEDKKNGDHNIRLSVLGDRIKAFLNMGFMAMLIVGITGGLIMKFSSTEIGKILLVSSLSVVGVIVFSHLLLKSLVKMRPTDHMEKLQNDFVEFLAPYQMKSEYSIASALSKFTEGCKLFKEREKLNLIREDYRLKVAKIESMDEDLDRICHNLNWQKNESESYSDVVQKLIAELKRNQMKLAAKNAMAKNLETEQSYVQNSQTQLVEMRKKLEKLNLTQFDEEKLQEMKKEFFRLNGETASMRNTYMELLDNNDMEVVASEYAALKNILKKGVAKYLKLQLILQYINDGIEKFEKEHQGDMINQASEYFSYITDNRYIGIKKSFTNGEIVCITANKAERKIDELSTGTREQLLFTMRLSLIDYIERNIESLPMVLDDIFVNFDYKRSAKMYEIVEKFAKTRQVLFFKLANEDKNGKL